MPRSFCYAVLCWCYTGYIIFLLLVCQDPASMWPRPGSSSCYVSVLYWLYYLYHSVYAKILAVCCLVLLMAVAMFQCYTDYIIFIAVCMPRSWQYAAWSCLWQLLCLCTILIILFLLQRVGQDPGSMQPGLGIGSCLLYWLYFFIAACMPRSWQYASWSCLWQLQYFNAILIILFLSQRVCQDPCHI